MASATVQGPWPAGTTVGVYPASALPPGASSPSGTALDTDTADADGRVSFDGLAVLIRYVAFGGNRQVLFLVQDASDAGRAADRDRLRTLELALADLLSTENTFTELDVVNAAGAALHLRDSDAGTDLKQFQAFTQDGKTYLRATNDVNDAITNTFFVFDHATGSVKLLGSPIVTADGLVAEAWTVVGVGGGPAYLNSWVAGGSPSRGLRFYKHMGRVWLEGFAGHAGTSSAVIFQLPAGYRPGAQVEYEDSRGGTEIVIESSGDVYVTSAVLSVQLDGVSFRAEN